jgi:sulfotransferase
MKQIYFLSGLPRSGSTVLAGILNQHPDVHASATSGLLDMLVGTLRAWADSMSTHATIDKEASEQEIRRILQNICETKYENIDKPIILDKARGWASNVNIQTMGKVFGYPPKIVATVRNIPDCAASFVRVAKPQDLDQFLREDELIGHLKESYQVLEAGYRAFPQCILFVDYDDLLSDPKAQLKRVHDFLGLKDFEYDLSNIDGSNLKERDEEVWQVKGLHDIKPVLARQHSENAEDVLQHMYSQFIQPRFWMGEITPNREPHPLDIMLAQGLMGNFAEAERIGEELAIREPKNHRAAFNRGWYILRKGHLLDGHREIFRGRIEKVFGNEPPKVPTPMWDGVSKGTVLLNLEGGLGDQIHGAGFVRYIVDRGCDVIIACSGQLATIFRDIPGVRAVVQHEAVFGVVHDFWVPSMSAVIPLGLQYKDVIGVPYISKPEVTKGERFRIGLRWQGNPQFEHEQHRLFPSQLLFNAMKDVDADFICLQRDVGAEHCPPWVRQVPLNHWEETRAAVASCDLVITSCTSVAHLSGAMGVPTWIAVPLLPYYLWAKPGSKTEWYDSVRLFRQKTFGDWSGVFQEVKEQLTETIGVCYAN